MDQSCLRDINAALIAWGYVNDPRGFLQCFDKQPGRRATQGERHEGVDAEWIQSVEDWLLEGDDILDSMQNFIVSGQLSCLCAEELGRIWGELSAVSFKVQLLMAGIEVRIDLLR
ncbi:hypothetical protein NUW54_g14313 [Trametes sanguinea]|uniref:Uncharacterized protein n=1 Tax=Trametes sanguinea TaxID=158606 RepID=A0ACC1MF84_9APHY|nr:hypothetical protein NUW54_g14313 [Trametes sanguinea]